MADFERLLIQRWLASGVGPPAPLVFLEQAAAQAGDSAGRQNHAARHMKVVGRILLALVLAGTACAAGESKAPAFLEECLGRTPLLTSAISCTSRKYGEDLRLVLAQGRWVSAYGEGAGTLPGLLFRRLRVRRIQHLPPRLTDSGYIGESVRFLAKGSFHSAVITIPCGQTDLGFVAVGVSVGDADERDLGEYPAACTVITADASTLPK